MNEAFIFDSIRSPRGKNKNGSLSQITPVDLLSKLMLALEKKYQLDTSLINDVIIGCVMPVNDQGANIGKIAAQYSGWDVDIPSMQINRCCGSGLEAVNLAAMKIRSGWEDLIVSGGIECMSRVPIGADLIATIEGFTRQDLDAYALMSQKRASEAIKNKRFRSLIPIYDQNELLLIAEDEHVRPNTSLMQLSKLKPAFEKIGKNGYDEIALQKYIHIEEISHLHTAGNSSGIVDGASITLVGSKRNTASLGLKPRARILSVATCSTDPTIMLEGPAPATKKALSMANLTIDDIDLIEVNEAFAAVVLKFMKEMNIDNFDKINVNGGSIALGHPLGATGSILLGTLMDELEERDLSLGLVTLCVAGGMGIATIIERV